MADLKQTEDGGSRPDPDPSVLTTEALQREIFALKELLAQRIGTLQELVEQRIEGMKAICDEEFRGIRDKLKLVEQQRVEQKSDTKLAVDAALAAQKEAVASQTESSERSIAKSEAATTKAIEQLGGTFTAALDGFRREIADLKERTGAIESGKKVTREVTQQRDVSFGQGLAAVSVVLLFLSVIAGIVVAVVA